MELCRATISTEKCLILLQNRAINNFSRTSEIRRVTAEGREISNLSVAHKTKPREDLILKTDWAKGTRKKKKLTLQMTMIVKNLKSDKLLDKIVSNTKIE